MCIITVDCCCKIVFKYNKNNNITANEYTICTIYTIYHTVNCKVGHILALELANILTEVIYQPDN